MKPLRNKFGAVKTTLAGIQFDSKAEAARYGQLQLLERTGQIAGITRQVAFVLAPSVKLHGARRAKPALRYVADFVYSDVRTGKIVVEDVKGVITPLFRVKQHLMMSVHGVDVRVVQCR